MNAKRGRNPRIKNLPFGRIPNTGIRLPINERKMFRNITRMNEFTVMRRMTETYPQYRKIVSDYTKFTEELELLIAGRNNAVKKPSNAILRALRNQCTKLDRVNLKLIKIRMYRDLLDFRLYIIGLKESPRIMSNFERKKNSLAEWRKIVGHVLLLKRMEWETKSRLKSPYLMEQHVQKLLKKGFGRGNKK